MYHSIGAPTRTKMAADINKAWNPHAFVVLSLVLEELEGMDALVTVCSGNTNVIILASTDFKFKKCWDGSF